MPFGHLRGQQVYLARLNPFGIRACLSAKKHAPDHRARVLIPLESGHAFRQEKDFKALQNVLIPLESGHAFRLSK